ncbi:MAG: ferritin family protein [Desulfobacterales bacterium]|nr:MAG: ferritin family protein [Desulfobacterales bacterium]
MKIEQNGEAIYRSAMEKIPVPSLVPLLEWIANEEANHAQWFSNLKQKTETNVENPFGQDIPRNMLNDIIGDQSFSLKEIDFSQVDNIEDLINIFIEFEKDSVLFYEMLQTFIQSEETLLQLDQIIAEEKRHIERLREFVENPSKIEKLTFST